MTAARGLLVLAMVAALIGAPSGVSAAANTLLSAQASPTTGTTDTDFTLTVTYDGRSDALAVRASLAGRVLDMGLATGTPAAGTWRVRTTLPAGTWPVVFAATVERGNLPTLAGLTLTVIGLDTPPPTIETTEPTEPTGEAPSVPPAAPDEPAGGMDTPPAPNELVAPVEEGTTSDEHDALPAGTPPPVIPPGTAEAVDAPVTAAGGEGEHDAPSEQDAPVATAPSAIPAPVADDEAAGEPDPAPGVEDDDLLAMVLLIGLTGVAAVALGGTAFLLATRRREQRADGPPTSMAGARDATEVPDEAGVSDVADRQAVRRARLQLTDDPIMAALGIDDDIAGRRARRRAEAAAHVRDGERQGGR